MKEEFVMFLYTIIHRLCALACLSVLLMHGIACAMNHGQSFEYLGKRAAAQFEKEAKNKSELEKRQQRLRDSVIAAQGIYVPDDVLKVVTDISALQHLIKQYFIDVTDYAKVMHYSPFYTSTDWIQSVDCITYDNKPLYIIRNDSNIVAIHNYDNRDKIAKFRFNTQFPILEELTKGWVSTAAFTCPCIFNSYPLASYFLYALCCYIPSHGLVAASSEMFAQAYVIVCDKKRQSLLVSSYAKSLSQEARCVARLERSVTLERWTLDGKLLKMIISGDELIQAIDVAENGLIATLNIAAVNNCIKIWDAELKLLNIIAPVGPRALRAVAINNNVVVTGDSAGNIDVYDCKTTRHIQTIAAHNDKVNVIKIFEDGSMVSGSEDNQIKIWDRDGSLSQSFKAKEPVMSISINNNAIICGIKNGFVAYFEKNDQKYEHVPEKSVMHNSSVHSLSFDACNDALIVGNKTNVWVHTSPHRVYDELCKLSLRQLACIERLMSMADLNPDPALREHLRYVSGSTDVCDNPRVEMSDSQPYQTVLSGENLVLFLSLPLSIQTALRSHLRIQLPTSDALLESLKQEKFSAEQAELVKKLEAQYAQNPHRPLQLTIAAAEHFFSLPIRVQVILQKVMNIILPGTLSRSVGAKVAHQKMD